MHHFCAPPPPAGTGRRDVFPAVRKQALKTLASLSSTGFTSFLSSPSSTLLALHKAADRALRPTGQTAAPGFSSRLAPPAEPSTLFAFLTAPYAYFYASKVQDMPLPGHRGARMADNLLAKTVLSIHRALAPDPPYDVYQLRHLKKTNRALGHLDNVYLAPAALSELGQACAEELNRQP